MHQNEFEAILEHTGLNYKYIYHFKKERSTCGVCFRVSHPSVSGMTSQTHILSVPQLCHLQHHPQAGLVLSGGEKVAGTRETAGLIASFFIFSRRGGIHVWG